MPRRALGGSQLRTVKQLSQSKLQTRIPLPHGRWNSVVPQYAAKPPSTSSDEFPLAFHPENGLFKYTTDLLPSYVCSTCTRYRY